MLVKKNKQNVNSLLQNHRNGKKKIADGQRKTLFYVEKPPETTIPLWNFNSAGRQKLPEAETRPDTGGPILAASFCRKDGDRTQLDASGPDFRTLNRKPSHSLFV